jgi:hypothetical protein
MDVSPIRSDTLPVAAAVAVFVVALAIILIIAASRRAARRRAEVPCRSCKRILMAEWSVCKFCGASRFEARAELEFISGSLQGRVVHLDREVTTIGTVAGNTVLLTDTGVSRKHVGIRKVEIGYELADLGSSNGVYVNGEKVARRKLSVGDVIRVGATEMVFRGG